MALSQSVRQRSVEFPQKGTKYTYLLKKQQLINMTKTQLLTAFWF